MKIKYLTIGEDKNDVYLLGYKLKLSPSEYKLLSLIGEHGRVSIERLTEELALPQGKKGNVPVHICSINRKAEIIGGRRLVLCENSEYYFNEYM